MPPDATSVGAWPRLAAVVRVSRDGNSIPGEQGVRRRGVANACVSGGAPCDRRLVHRASSAGMPPASSARRGEVHAATVPVQLGPPFEPPCGEGKRNVSPMLGNLWGTIALPHPRSRGLNPPRPGRRHMIRLYRDWVPRRSIWSIGVRRAPFSPLLDVESIRKGGVAWSVRLGWVERWVTCGARPPPLATCSGDLRPSRLQALPARTKRPPE